MSHYDQSNNEPPDEEKDFQMEQVKKRAKKSKTPTLDHFGRDLTNMAAHGLLDPVIGRDKESNQMIEILGKRGKSNPMLLGESGIGKSSLVYKLAQKIATKDINSSFFEKRIIELNLTTIVSGTKYRGMFEERMEAIVREAVSNKDVILFIDELHMLMGAGNGGGAMDASNILKPVLARGEMKLIGSTTFEEYQKYIEKDKALARRFQKISVNVQNSQEIVEILKQIKHKYEDFHGVKYSDEIIIKIVDLTDRYITDKNNPDKAIDLMDEVGSKIKLKNPIKTPENILDLKNKIKNAVEQKIIAKDAQEYETAAKYKELEDNLKKNLEEEENKFKIKLKSKSLNKIEVLFDDVARVISDYTDIPLTSLTEKEISKLSRLEKELKSKIIGQDDAVKKVVDAIKRTRVGISDPRKPNSFLYLGGTGVGKTEMVKQLAKILFDSEDAIIRFDMSEYSMPHEVSKLIGAPPGFIGHEEGGLLTEKVKNKPYSIVLFDEFEKAHPDFKNMMLQILDDGTLTDSQGRKVNFRNTLIIMTSNIGTSKMFGETKIGFSSNSNEKINLEQEVMMELKKHPVTSPEFLNRIDSIVVFNNLEKDSIRKIVDLQLESFLKRMLKDKNITIKVGIPIREFLCEVGFDKMYGARPLKRAITIHIENVIAQGFVDQIIKDGDKVTLDIKDKEIFIKK